MQEGTKQRVARVRKERLAEALRENLKRRKSQTRARKSAPDDASDKNMDADKPAPEQD